MNLYQSQRGVNQKMSKKLRIRAIGAIILSAMLFMLPIGALFANNTMTAPVLAADESASQNESEATSGNADEDVSGNEEESTSENAI